MLMDGAKPSGNLITSLGILVHVRTHSYTQLASLRREAF